MRWARRWWWWWWWWWWWCCCFCFRSSRLLMAGFFCLFLSSSHLLIYLSLVSRVIQCYSSVLPSLVCVRETEPQWVRYLHFAQKYYRFRYNCSRDERSLLYSSVLTDYSFPHLLLYHSADAFLLLSSPLLLQLLCPWLILHSKLFTQSFKRATWMNTQTHWTINWPMDCAPKDEEKINAFYWH